MGYLLGLTYNDVGINKGRLLSDLYEHIYYR